MDSPPASVRVRPLRFGFVIDPTNRPALRKVLRVNSCLWGGTYNYLIPRFKRFPPRYKEQYTRNPRAADLVNGLVEAFQPDYLVEAISGISKGIRFDASRVIALDAVMPDQGTGRPSYGIDLRCVFASLYKEAFRFVQRHPPKAFLPRPPSRQFDLLFAAAFGEIPDLAEFAEFREDFRDVLGGNEQLIQAEGFNGLFEDDTLWPLRIGRHELAAQPQGWMPDPTLFYMDEGSPHDVIEYWNLRAIGWHICPLPVSWAERLRQDCETFIQEAHKERRDAAFLCSRSCSFEGMQAFVSSLRRSADAVITVSNHFPRLWQEWGRHADHAEPQRVTNRIQLVETHSIGNVVSIRTTAPPFLKLSGYAASRGACANVIEALPGGAAVIPWQSPGMKQVAGPLSGNEMWIGREGVTLLAGEFQRRHTLQRPSPIQIFRSWASALGFELELSASGRTAEQMARALVGRRIRLFGHEDTLRLFDRLAHGDLELELTQDADSSKKRRVRMASAPEAHVREVLGRVSGGDSAIVGNYLKSLIDCHALRLGMRLQCPECLEHTWFGVKELDITLTCARCLQTFPFPQSKPPKDAWAYRVSGPFAVENFCHGAYSVLMAVQFLVEHVAEASTWIPSFTLKRNGNPQPEAEADFGMFVRPGRLSKLTDPALVIAECKSFGPFESRDFARMQKLAELLPGAVLCFCSFAEEFSPFEKKAMAQISRSGRRPLRTGRQTNPVLVLTRSELFGQFDAEGFGHRYQPPFAERAPRVFSVGEIEEICDLTQQVHLGIEPYRVWRNNRRRAKKSSTPNKPPG